MVGCITAAFRSLFMHISCASSSATECHLCPLMLTVNPPSLKHCKISLGNC